MSGSGSIEISPCVVRLIAVGIALGLALGPGPSGARAAAALWDAHVEPLLKEHCIECHNPTKAKSALDLTSLQTILRGGDRGAAVLPGRPDDSNLYKFLSAEADPHMPPGKRKPLSAEETGLIKLWIQQLPATNRGEPTATDAPTAPVARARPRIPWKPPDTMPPAQVVDRFLQRAWKLDQIQPSARASDAAFVRRLYLDLVGRIPTVAEATDFVADRAKDKRAQLIDRLLAGAEHPRHLREIFDPVLMTRRGAEWEKRRANEKWFAFLEEAFRQNRPWNQLVRELILARPEREQDRGAVWYLYERKNNPQTMAEALAPIVFGVQINCAQCHDHMVAREIKQAHYWGLVAALNRSKNVDTPAGPAVAESAIGGFASFANLKKESQPALLTFFNGKRVEELWPKEGEKETDSPALYRVPPPPAKEKAKTAAVPIFSRREALADAVTRENPLLARAIVNRVWALLFGRGLVHPVELMDSQHPPSHPELLAWLARDFEQNGYDLKRLIRTLAQTRAYQLDSRETRPARSKPAPPESFARALDKPLSAEQLVRSLRVATGDSAGQPGQAAGMAEDELLRGFIAQFPDLFPAEYNASLQQAMFLSNSRLLDPLVTPQADNLAARLLAIQVPDLQVREAFAAVFGREPDRDELHECAGYLRGRSPEPGVKQLLWALLTSAEFQLNH